MNCIELAIQALTGGITGYVTNRAAVKMIFQKVLGFGGLIIETREEFIENVSQLVGRDVINHGTLQGELSKAEFNGEVTKIVNDFLQKQLYEVTQKKSLGQIPKMTESLNNFVGFIREKQTGMIDEVLKLFSDTISLQDILSKKQLEFCVGQTIDACFNILQETEIFDSFISIVYRQYKDENLGDFVPSTMVEVVTENLNKVTANLHNKLEKDSDQIVQQLLDDLYAQFDIGFVVAELEKNIKNKTFVELFGRTHTENMSSELLQHIIQFLKSPEGQNLLEQTSDYLFTTIKEIRMPLFNLFQPELAGNIESFLASKLPGVVNQLIMWLKQNQEWLEKRIEEALQSTLAQETGHSAWLKRLLYERFAKNALVSKFQIVAKVIQGIKDNADVRILSEEISLEIIGYLKNTNISELIGSLESRGIFTSQDITLLIKNNMDKLAAQVDLKAADSFFNRKLGELIQLPLAEPIESYVKGLLVKFKQEYLYTAKFTEAMQKELRLIVQGVSTRKFSGFVPAEAFDANVPELKKMVLAQLEKRREYFAAILVSESQKLMENKKISHILNASLQSKITENIADKINLVTLDGLEELQQRSIYSVYDRVNTMPNLGTRLASGGINLLKNHLEAITKGQIEAIVSSNLSKLQNQQLQEVVEGFMGKELKPISWLGAFLGVLAGLAFGLVKSRYNLTGSLSLVCSVPVYGLVGYLTNKQALWMIFHPYRPWRIFGKDVPLTQGVIVKNKPRFAKSMAHFVGEELLNSQSSVKLFKDNRENLTKILNQSISENNYKILENFLLANTSVISSELIRAGDIFAAKHLETWSQKLADEFQNIPLKVFDFGQLKKIMKVYGLDLPTKMQPYLADRLEGMLQEKRSLRQVLPDKVKQFAGRKMDSYMDTYLDRQWAQLQGVLTNQQLFAKIAASALAQPFTILTSQSLKELIEDKHKEAIKKVIADRISEQLRSESNRKKIQEVIQEKILKELDPNKKIMDLFEGKLFEVFAQNVHPILDLLTAKITILLDNERENLKSAAKKEARGTKGYEVANSLLHIDSTIDDVVDHLVDKTAPEIMSQSRDDLSSYLLKSLSHIGESKVNEIKIDLTEQGIVDIVSNVLDNKTLNKQLRILSGGVIESLADFPLETLLRAAGIKRTEDVFAILASELNLVRKTLNDSLVNKEVTLKMAISTAATKIFADIASGIAVSPMFEGVDKEDINRSVDRALTKIKESEGLRTAVEEFTEAIMTYANAKELKAILDSAVLQSDFKQVITLLIQDKEATNKLKAALERTLTTFSLNINGMLEIETKEFIASIVVEGILNALEEQIADLVKTLDLKDITEREINNMNPQEIEDLFNSFAKHYFRKLELYGFWGGLLGILMELLIY